jgi:uncharacterized protein (DUF58 family)
VQARAPGSARGDAFPLVPRRRLHGLELGPFRSVRRGLGSDPAGSRPYEPGDDVRAIDWWASARLSAARGADEFVVRERFAEQAPRVVMLVDRRPAMALHPAPWLRKPAVLSACERLIVESALRARGLVGSLHHGIGEPVWRPPSANPRTWWAQAGADGEFQAPPGSLADGVVRLAHTRALPPGSFLFVLSDFVEPVPVETWLACVVRGWDVVPVIVQDPTWESSFPVETGGLVVPVSDPRTGEPSLVRVSRSEARALREEHERRLEELVAGFAELGLDPVVLHSADDDVVLAAFLAWAAARIAPAGRAW